MSKKADYTAEEWAALLRAPGMAGLVVVAASPSGPIGAVQESFAMSKLIAEVKQKGGANELVGAIVDDMLTAEGRAAARASDLFGKKADELKAFGLATVHRASEIVAAKSPGEADAFKRWLLALSQATAEGAREGGFFGFGGTLVSEQEQAALAEVSRTLGLA